MNCSTQNGFGLKAHLACRLRIMGSSRILRFPVIQIFVLADFDQFQPAPRAVLQTVNDVTGNDGLMIASATINKHAFGSTVTCQRFPEKLLC